MFVEEAADDALAAFCTDNFCPERIGPADLFETVLGTGVEPSTHVMVIPRVRLMENSAAT